METINVLVVDDDKEIVNAICKLLESEGYKTLKAYDVFVLFLIPEFGDAAEDFRAVAP